jgi:hypothetical protein
MNEFASALSATLREKAQEIAMSTDMQHGERQLQESIRSVERRRRVRIALAVAAGIVIIGVGMTLGVRHEAHHAQPASSNSTAIHPAQQPILFHAGNLPAPFTVRLPRWINSTAHFVDNSGVASAYAFQALHGARDIHLLSVRYMYPFGATKITEPSYAALVADWKAVQTHHYGTVRDVTATTVGGKPATAMTVRFTRSAPGLDYCDAATGKRNDPYGCGAPNAGRIYHVAIVNEGRTVPPTVLWESSLAYDTARPSVATEFAGWLATVRFN